MKDAWKKYTRTEQQRIGLLLGGVGLIFTIMMLGFAPDLFWVLAVIAAITGSVYGLVRLAVSWVEKGDRF